MYTTGAILSIIAVVAIFIRKILFAIGKGLCWIIGFLTDVFDMVAGLSNVTYRGLTTESMPLIKVFFTYANINTIYWGMALIGIMLCFAFAIFAVIRKSADSGDKVKQSIGDIIKNLFKGVTLILLMNFIMSATINITSTLMDRINYLIVNAQSFDLSYDVTFSSKDYAAMGRCLNTIGNYSINASYNSRYNLNSCYNSIRSDLKQLGDDGKFDDTYITTVHEDGTSRTVNTWQSVLQNIYRAVDDINTPQPLDEYNTKLEDAMLEAMEVIRNDASFEALENYHVDKSSKSVGDTVRLDRMIMLIGSLYGTGGEFARGNSLTDYIRGPYYYGQKDIFSYSEVSEDFDMSVGTWLYLTVIIVGFFFAKEMLGMVFNATARIFNMLLLYISAPPFIAVTPLDDGGKLKQWTTAFIIQSFGLFGTIISLRLVMIFIPIIFSGDIQFFEGARMDTFTRILIMYGALFTSRKASGMIVGILADNAGWQAISAGDVGSDARSAIESGVGFAKSVGSFAYGFAKERLAKADDKHEKAKEKAEAKREREEEERKSKGGGDTKPDSPTPPQNMLDIGSRSNAQQSQQAAQAQQGKPPDKANVAAQGANAGGSAKQAGAGGGPKLEAIAPAGEKSREAPQLSNRPDIGKDPVQKADKPDNGSAAANNVNNGQNADAKQAAGNAQPQAAPEGKNALPANNADIKAAGENNAAQQNNNAVQQNNAAQQNNAVQNNNAVPQSNAAPANNAPQQNNNAPVNNNALAEIKIDNGSEQAAAGEKNRKIPEMFKNPK